MKGCEEYKKTFKTLDCNAYCTVEYGAPKPTDEVCMYSVFFVFLCDFNAYCTVKYAAPKPTDEVCNSVYT